MTIPLTGAGSLFVRLGHLFGGGLDDLALQGGTATARVLAGASWITRENTIFSDYGAGTVLPAPLTGTIASLDSALAAWRGSQSPLFSLIQSVAQQTLIQMAHADTPLTALTPQAAIALLISQMKTASASVNQSVVSAGAQTNVGTPTGNPVIVLSTKSGNGLVLEMVVPETITFTCTADSQGTATAGNEPVLATSTVATQNAFAYNWPTGSAAGANLSAVDGSKSNPTSGNLLTNSDFLTTTTANNPDNWTLGVGAAGTDIFAGSGLTPYTTSGGALKFTGTGSALLDGVTQSFSTTPVVTVGAGGTAAVLKADTVYHVVCWVKVSATPAAGVLELALTDGSAYPGAVQNDDQAVANTATLALTGSTTAYAKFTAIFRTPAVLPTTTPPLKLRLRLSTAIDSGKSVFIGRLSLAQAVQLYPNGPFASVHSGNVAMINGLTPDQWTVAMTNTFGAFQKEFQRYGLTAPGQLLPSSTTPTISDSLVA